MSRLQISKSEQTANIPTRPIDADRPIKLGGRVMARPVGMQEKKRILMRTVLLAIAISGISVILSGCLAADVELMGKVLDPRRFQANAETRVLCKKDGGIHVSSEVKLQEGRFPTIIPDEKDTKRQERHGVIYGKYKYDVANSSSQDHGYTIYRDRTSITSIDDGKLIGEMIRYVRQGEPGLPGLICPENINTEKFINAVFKKEGEHTDPYPACSTGTPEKISLTPDSPARLLKEDVEIDSSKQRWKERGVNCAERTSIDTWSGKTGSNTTEIVGTRLLFFGQDGNRCQSLAMFNSSQIVCHENGITVLGYKQLPPSSFLMQTFSLTGEMVREIEISDVAKFRDPLMSYRETETSINIRTMRSKYNKSSNKRAKKRADCYSVSISKGGHLSTIQTKRLGPPDNTFGYFECDTD